MKILIVDDHPSVMEGTKVMLEKEPDFEITLCQSPSQAQTIIRQQPFDIMLFDLYMPEMNGIELTRAVISLVPDAIVLIYTGSDIATLFNKMIEAGASGFISKTATQEQLVTVIRCAARKEAVIPFSLLRELRRDTFRLSEVEEEGKVALNDKDQLLLREIAKGKGNREMAENMLMSQRSLEYALTRLFQKLKVSSRIQAVERAKELGILLHDDFI